MNTMKIYLPIALLSGVLMAVPACDTINSTERTTPVGQADVVQDHRIVTDSALNSYAKVVSVNQGTVSGDILKIQVMLQNTTPFQQRIIYKFEWYDMTGMLVDTPLSTWQARTLEGKETITVTGVAPTPQTKDFKLKLQESKWN